VPGKAVGGAVLPETAVFEIIAVVGQIELLAWLTGSFLRFHPSRPV
jgi:hypothetical protein